MSDPSNTDLAVQIATLSGKLDGFIATSAAREAALAGRLDESALDRRDIHKRLDSLERWRAWMLGFAGSGTLLGLWAAARMGGIIH